MLRRIARRFHAPSRSLSVIHSATSSSSSAAFIHSASACFFFYLLILFLSAYSESLPDGASFAVVCFVVRLQQLHLLLPGLLRLHAARPPARTRAHAQGGIWWCVSRSRRPGC